MLKSGISAKNMTKWKPHQFHVGMTMRYSSSLTVAQIQLKVLIAGIFQARSMDLSVAANFVCQSPMHMPDTK